MAKRILQVVAALAVVAAVGAFVYVQLDDPDACDVCYRPMHQETFYRIHLEGGDTKDVCCPRCGLRFQEGRNDVVATEVTDFNTKQRIDAAKAYYVENSPVHFCSHAGMHEDRSGVQYEVAWDRCLPSLIAFSSREAAQKFQHDNGGDIKTYQELLAEHS
jgi:hypothetical protein